MALGESNDVWTHQSHSVFSCREFADASQVPVVFTDSWSRAGAAGGPVSVFPSTPEDSTVSLHRWQLRELLRWRLPSCIWRTQPNFLTATAASSSAETPRVTPEVERICRENPCKSASLCGIRLQWIMHPSLKDKIDFSVWGVGKAGVQESVGQCETKI